MSDEFSARIEETNMPHEYRQGFNHGMKEALEAVEKKITGTNGTTYSVPAVVGNYQNGFIAGHKQARLEILKEITAWLEALQK